MTVALRGEGLSRHPGLVHRFATALGNVHHPAGYCTWGMPCHVGATATAQLTRRCSVLAILLIGANPKPGKISRKGGRRPSRVTRSALVGDLCPASHWSAGRMVLLQFARLALIVAAPGRCVGPRGRLARRRRRGPGGLRAANGAQARNVSPGRPAPVIDGSCAGSGSASSLRGACPEW